ncbi:hypothetical protein KSZ_77570 [Dictyobacter formicarum]|uniref:Uncharacterized protein n=1 Tax=Dictyobacter formicarum TaxID=2778368 RepID=A0ABQ3VVG4_9CHLR|nr:hypothetical protein KSZ_77570 [Dictyobacter formicarum]
MKKKEETRGATLSGACSILTQKTRLKSDMGWEIDLWGVADIISWLQYEYVIPAILITENGAAFEDRVEANGRIVDVRRL